jgi:hypothetical protein
VNSRRVVRREVRESDRRDPGDLQPISDQCSLPSLAK